MGGDATLLCAYGIYLMNGGTKDGFLDLNPYEAQLIVSTDISLRKRESIMIANAVGKMLFKGDKE